MNLTAAKEVYAMAKRIPRNYVLWFNGVQYQADLNRIEGCLIVWGNLEQINA